MRCLYLFAITVAVISAVIGCGQAEEPANGEYEILSSCLNALGGRAAVESLRVIHTVDSLSMAGMTGITESWWIREPFTGFSVTRIGPITQQVLIKDDSVWSVDRNGHLSPGGVEERDQMQLSKATVFYDYLLDPSAVSIGRDTVLQDSVTAVPFYLENQPNVVMYYSRETWLPVLMTAETMGLAVESRPFDYAETQGIVSARRSTSTVPALGQDIVNRNVLTEYNVAVPESIFVMSSPPGDWELSNAEEAFPMRLRGEHIYLDGEISGRPVNVLLDSGAGATVMDSSLAALMELETTGRLPARGIGGTREFSFVKVDYYSAAGAILRNQTVAVMPLTEQFYPSTGEKIDLILGYDFLSRFVTKLDYGEETITLFSPDSFSIDETDASIVPAERSMSLLSVEAVLEDSIPVKLLLDTGAGGNVHLTPTFFSGNPDFLAERSSFETEIEGVGGAETISGFRAATLTLGDYTVPGGICSSFSGGDMFSSFDGILGNGILSRFVLYLDYSGNRIIVKPSSLYEEGLGENLTGIGMEIHEGNLRVRNVIPGSAADSAGIEKGDILLEIDGTAVFEEGHGRPGRPDSRFRIQNVENHPVKRRKQGRNPACHRQAGTHTGMIKARSEFRRSCQE